MGVAVMCDPRRGRPLPGSREFGWKISCDDVQSGARTLRAVNALVDAADPVQCVEDQASIDVVSPTFTQLFSGNATGIWDLVPTQPIGQCDFTGSSHAFSTQLIKDGLNEIRVRGSATSNGSSTSADVLIGFIDSVTK
jgi:hypothetical protein